MVIKEILKDAVFKLRLSNNDNPVFEAHQIAKCVLNMNSCDLVLNHEKELTKSEISKINDMILRRTKKEPLQYILGTQEFMSLEFIVTPSVLIPRADTETLVEFVLSKMQNKSFSLLDIGTGTGCIPLSIAHYNKNTFARALDISKDAIEIAKKNCNNLSLSDRVTFEVLDILTNIPSGKFDIITSNPPYIKKGDIELLQDDVKIFEPRLALDGGTDGLLFYRRICDIAPTILQKDGMLVFEIGFDQANDVSNLMKERFESVEIIKDLCGNDRVAAGKVLL